MVTNGLIASTMKSSREALDRETIQKRLLLCLYGLGTNTGLQRISNGTPNVHHHDLRYIKRRFVHKEALRQAITQVANAIFQIRLPQIWGYGTTTCASDSKKFGAWDQNLMTEWHVRYGGRGVMIYWHVEKNSTCIYSQLKTCSSSEVAAMIEGVLRHDTEMTVKKNFVDSHGQSEVAFAFCHLLGFQLMPRLKAIKRQKLYRLAKYLREERPDYNYLKSVFRHLRTELEVEVPKAQNKLPNIPSEEEIKRYYDAVWQARNVQDMVIIKTLLYTGVRVSELVNIKLENVDFERCQIRINDGKGGKDRIVPFPISFKEVLALHVDQMSQKKATYLFEPIFRTSKCNIKQSR